MRENKRKLKFKKIKIANMNILIGGGETHTIPLDECTRNEVSDIQNPCSDECLLSQNGIIDTAMAQTGFNEGICYYKPNVLCPNR